MWCVAKKHPFNNIWQLDKTHKIIMELSGGKYFWPLLWLLFNTFFYVLFTVGINYSIKCGRLFSTRISSTRLPMPVMISSKKLACQVLRKNHFSCYSLRFFRSFTSVMTKWKNRSRNSINWTIRTPLWPRNALSVSRIKFSIFVVFT